MTKELFITIPVPITENHAFFYRKGMKILNKRGKDMMTATEMHIKNTKRSVVPMNYDDCPCFDCDEAESCYDVHYCCRHCKWFFNGHPEPFKSCLKRDEDFGIHEPEIESHGEEI